MKMLNAVKVFYWNTIRTNQFLNQIEEYTAWKELFSHSVDHYRDTLIGFMLFCNREGISYVSKEDINDYKIYLLNKETPFTMKKSMSTIRDMFRYWGARKVMCIDSKWITDDGIVTNLVLSDILRNMTKKISTVENKDRNKELVMKRIKNPLVWTYGELGAHFNTKRETAFQLFKRHVFKYVTKEQYKRYQEIVDKTYA